MYQMLLYTNLLLVISLIYFYFYSVKTWIEYSLAALLVAVIITSQIFWRNPIRGTLIHIIDSILAKICVFIFMSYTIFYKLESTEIAIAYSIILSLLGLSTWSGNHYSNIQWCSPDHIKSHAFMHFFCFMASFFALL